MGYTRAELEASRGRGVPDLLGRHTKLLFVGINPGLWTAAAQAHFAKRGNRFYPALHLAGLTDSVIDASAGFRPVDRQQLISRGIGITNLVNRATARADELDDQEIRLGAAELERRLLSIKPRVVVILGITAYRVAFNRPRASEGWQEDLGPSSLMVTGNPSGLNARQTVMSLAARFREAAQAAGVALT
ncbi:MAG TPA: mismatch-specific DNA-glycosylase [Acidimicrobiia bacterium]|nr:mismatch-specific DNA-glycosylase [Acidimicrobiia bacterium]